MKQELKRVIEKFRQVEDVWVSPVKNSDEYLAATSLFEYASYRLLASSQHDRLVGFRVLLRTIRRILRPGAEVRVLDKQGESLILSGTIAIQDRVTEYISRSGHKTIHSYLAKDIVSLKTPESLSVLPQIIWFGLRQSIRCIGSKYRQQLALSIAEVVEIAYIVEFIRKNKITVVYDFVPYEIDSNFMYLLLRETGAHVVKVPSSGPLVTHHRVLLSDDVVFSTPYHFEEQAKFKETLRVKNVLLWPPERAYQYYPRYKNENPKPERKTLGFYSHGEWLRKEEKHTAYGGRIGDAEVAILGYLGQYIKEHPDFKLLVFPHPKEMRPDVVERMKAFYTRTIGHDNFRIADWPGGTSQNFDKVDIAVAAFSTILYERLYCGFKTIIGNMAINEFPMNKSVLNKICFRTYEAMSEMITEYSAQDEDYFFHNNAIDNYRAAHFPEP